MILKAIIEDQVYTLNVPDAVLQNGEEVFAKLDSDMDKGWQMSRDWVDLPNQEQRCQIIGDKMLTAMHKDNAKMMVLLSAYVLARVPGITGIRIDTNGEMLETELVIGPG